MPVWFNEFYLFKKTRYRNLIPAFGKSNPQPAREMLFLNYQRLLQMKIDWKKVIQLLLNNVDIYL